ncbi:hypothetical protein CDL12_21765 [Handroanthus impetiginosus]|uniref:Uncharacterized protein n=1 Tax=Handroanthus impetiginosus TaxID=429701 RepID=A0A2G9GK71_9LAMI|nr:hypothetical protein CDL12_21765 [Handroanthus impetiginosus]
MVSTPIADRYARPWPQLANLFYMKKWSREVHLSKTLKVWILLAVHHQHSNELIHHQQLNSSDGGSRQLSTEDFSFPTLSHRIIQEKARLGDVLQFVGEFQYIKVHWEWTKDIYNTVYALLFTYDQNSEVMKTFFEVWCPLINTLLTSFGEFFKELIGVDQMNNRFIPRSCKYLFHAYYLFRKSAIGIF